MGRPPHRPLKLTDDLQETICQHIEAGQLLVTAAEVSGISTTTFHRWMQLGEPQLDEHGKVVRAARPRFRDFRAAVTRAKVRAEVTAIMQIRVAANNDWRAAGWWLERVHREKYSRQTEVVGKGGGPLKITTSPGGIDLSNYTTEELEQLEKLLSKEAMR